MATATVEKTVTTQQRLEVAQTRMAALKAEGSGLAEAMQQALADGDKSRYLDLMVRENQLPRELAEAEGDVRSLRRQGLQERYEALAAEEPELRTKHQEGVDMLPGDPKEREGPEDALGQGLKRGDYRGRVVSDTPSYTFERGPDGVVRKVLQNPRVREIGDVPGLKGGVDTGGRP